MKVRVWIPVAYEIEGKDMFEIAYNWWDRKREIYHYEYPDMEIDLLDEEYKGDSIEAEFLEKLQYVEETDDKTGAGFVEWKKEQEE